MSLEEIISAREMGMSLESWYAQPVFDRALILGSRFASNMLDMLDIKFS